MSDPKQSSKGPKTPKEARLKAALKENMAKRKAQARARAQSTSANNEEGKR